VNPNYKPPSNLKPQGYRNDTAPPPRLSTSTPAAPSTRDIVIGGIAFETSFRSLVRKDRKSLSFSPPRNDGGHDLRNDLSFSVPKQPQAPIKAPLRSIPQQTDFSRTTNGHRIPAGRGYKSKVSSRTQPRRPRNRNMTLDNTRGPSQSVYQSDSFEDSNLIGCCRGRRANKRMKYLDKPCPRFTTTGASSVFSTNDQSSTQMTACHSTAVQVLAAVV
jgi:hypothetical protein